MTGVPMLWMYVMSAWALLRFVKTGFFTEAWQFRWTRDPVAWVALVLVALAALLLAEAIKVLTRPIHETRGVS